MRAYSADLRERVFGDIDAGMRTGEIARKYSVSDSWVRRIKQRRAQTGETAPRAPARPGPVLAPQDDRIRQAVRDRPDSTLAELHAALGLSVCVTTLWNALRRLKLTLKKR